MRSLATLLFACLCLALAGCPPTPISITVSSGAHDFGISDTVWSFDIWQSTAGTALTVQISANRPWLGVTPESATTAGPDDKISVQVIVDRTQLAPGVNSAVISVDAGTGGKRTVEITASAPAAAIRMLLQPEAAVSAGAQWRVDEGNWQNSGIVLPNLVPGAHTITFSEISGWGSPSPLSVDLAANETQERTATYTPQRGAMRVVILPAAAVQAGAQWRVDAGAWQTSGTVADGVAAGAHTLTFKDLPGWQTPAAQTITIIASTQLEASAEYVPQNGALRVNISPASARAAGARWRMDGGVWQSSGETLSEIMVGPHTVAFSAIDGWNTPANILVTIPVDQTVEISGTYTQGTGAVRVGIEPAGARAAGAQWRIDGGTWHNSLDTVAGVSAGDHTITFRTIAAWTIPDPILLTVVSGETATSSGTYTGLQAGNMVVLGYNDLGMHCMNQDFSNLMILPPFNTLHATVIDRSGEEPRIVTSGITVTYEIPSNTTSVGKTNFWEYAPLLFGVELPADTGLTGNGLAGTMAPPQVPGGENDWVVTGIPLTPLDDAMVEDPYPLATVSVLRNGVVQAQTQAVVPVSWEISCSLCHDAPDVSPDIDILRDHDRLHGTSLEAQRPVVCGACHGQPPLGLAGDPNLPTLSSAIHSAHANRMAQAGLEVSCYACHPGVRTQCLRDVHFAAGLDCMDCHGQMSDVGNPARSPWAEEPRCDSCHARNGFEFEQPATLYRNSKGHHGVHCAACHGSPHAITPTVTPEDNIQALLVQGHEGTINTCSVCHRETPDDPFPHRVEEDENDD